MKVVLDNTSRKKLIVVKNDTRLFSLDFPIDANTAEIYEIIAFLKKEVHEGLKREMEEKAKELMKEEKIDSTILEEKLVEVVSEEK